MDEQLIKIEADGVVMHGALALPEHAMGVVLFANGKAGGHASAGNERIAAALQAAGMGTLQLEPLSDQEEKDFYTRSDITVLTQRLDKAAAWLGLQAGTRALPLALFGAGTGAAAALQLAAWRGKDIAAVVSRGGRPDMAGRPALEKVSAPTLLIVGGLDNDGIGLNRMAFSALPGDAQLEVINGAGARLDDAVALDAVTALAKSWLTRHFAGKAS
ncbi:alpha/beta hydrolase [Janthinobacterium sp.]|uniref:alpha/beta hydrolase n=1 Tax=Janthinobacterium sp. TaxID=1871054 RepID=UPI00293D81B3|nr:alpha/beta hydrolase [Janthinobacterium sp.]